MDASSAELDCIYEVQRLMYDESKQSTHTNPLGSFGSNQNHNTKRDRNETSTSTKPKRENNITNRNETNNNNNSVHKDDDDTDTTRDEQCHQNHHSTTSSNNTKEESDVLFSSNFGRAASEDRFSHTINSTTTETERHGNEEVISTTTRGASERDGCRKEVHLLESNSVAATVSEDDDAMEQSARCVQDVHRRIHVIAVPHPLPRRSRSGEAVRSVREDLFPEKARTDDCRDVLVDMARSSACHLDSNIGSRQSNHKDSESKINCVPCSVSDASIAEGHESSHLEVQGCLPIFDNDHRLRILERSTDFRHGSTCSGGHRCGQGVRQHHGPSRKDVCNDNTVHTLDATRCVSNRGVDHADKLSDEVKSTVPPLRNELDRRKVESSSSDPSTHDRSQRRVGTEEHSKRRTATDGEERSPSGIDPAILSPFGRRHADEIPLLGSSGDSSSRRDGQHDRLVGGIPSHADGSDDERDDIAISTMIESCHEFKVDSNRHRLFAKRPTKIARAEHAHLPLHTQTPPLKKLSWDIADSIIKIAATDGEQRVWFATTKAYRDQSVAIQLYSDRDFKQDVDTDPYLFGNDLQNMIDSEFAIDSGLTVEQFEATQNFAYVKLFLVIESKPSGDRRRIIGWPRSLNPCEKKVIAELAKQHAKVRWYSASDVRNRGVKFSYAASIDFKKFFQQFLLHSKNFFAFKFKGRVYFLSSIPTGAVYPPLFAQALSRAILQLAVRTACVEHLVEYDCCIDNLRLCSDNLHALWAAWFELLHICDALGATIGEMNPPPREHQSPYTYLGMLFYDEGSPSVKLASKSISKIDSAIELLSSRRTVLVVDAIALFGQTVWATTVTNFKLGRLYYVIKFIRRIQRRELNDDTNIWPSIVDTWIAALTEMKTAAFTTVAVTSEVITYTDASDDGWGVVVVGFGDRMLRVFAGKWSPEERSNDINVRELRAIRIGVRLLSKLTCELNEPIGVHFRVDNTTARSWTMRSRAPKFVPNQIALELDREAVEANLHILTVDYVRSEHNISDKASRKFSSKSTASAHEVGEMGD